MPNILSLVVRRFDNNLCKLTTKLNGNTSIKIGNYNYNLNRLIEHYGEAISRGHCSCGI